MDVAAHVAALRVERAYVENNREAADPSGTRLDEIDEQIAFYEPHEAKDTTIEKVPPGPISSRKKA